jgi:hypothetical protein
MLASEVDYDVYTYPRLSPVQFGDYIAGEGRERERILRAAKYYKRAPRSRAWFAKEAIASYLISPSRSIGHLDAALQEAKNDAANATLSDQRKMDASVSADSLAGFTAALNKMKIAGKDMFAVEGEQKPINFAGISLQADLACLVSSTSRSEVRRVGGILLNTQRGNGLGSKEDTVKKRDKAGEAVALLILHRMLNEFSDYGEPCPEDCIHVYARAKHVWCAPKSYVNKLGNMEAEARGIVGRWENISAPDDFMPSRANFHKRTP